MWKYLKYHEKYILEILDKNDNDNWEKLRQYHKTQIEFLQHERFIHLMVTLFVSLFILLLVSSAVYTNIRELFIISILFLVLLVPYIVHYYRLENGVQRWYELYNKIDERCKQ